MSDTLLSAVTATGAGSAVATRGVKSLRVHVYSAAGASATVLIQISVDGSAWNTVATISNPGTGGELWVGPAAEYVRANVSARSSGTITAVSSTSDDERSQWVSAAPASSSVTSGGLIKYAWTTAEVVALGAGLTGDITIGSVPAKSIIRDAYVVITEAGAGTATLTVALGGTATAYTDLIVASDAKAAANTIYGNASGERGTSNTGYDLRSYTAATTLKLHFIATTNNLDQCSAGTGVAYVLYETLP